MSLASHERRKYQKAWAIPEYGHFSPGLNVLPLFRQMVRKRPGTLLDIGCGGGAASDALADLGWTVSQLDHVDVPGRGDYPFIRSCLWARWPTSQVWQQGYCCDVLEHLPPEKVRPSLERMFAHCDRVFFSVNFNQDHFGSVVGHPLHLTIRPFEWWRDLLGQYGELSGARDILGEGVFDVAR